MVCTMVDCVVVGWGGFAAFRCVSLRVEKHADVAALKTTCRRRVGFTGVVGVEAFESVDGGGLWPPGIWPS